MAEIFDEELRRELRKLREDYLADFAKLWDKYAEEIEAEIRAEEITKTESELVGEDEAETDSKEESKLMEENAKKYQIEEKHVAKTGSTPVVKENLKSQATEKFEKQIDSLRERAESNLVEQLDSKVESSGEKVKSHLEVEVAIRHMEKWSSIDKIVGEKWEKLQSTLQTKESGWYGVLNGVRDKGNGNPNPNSGTQHKIMNPNPNLCDFGKGTTNPEWVDSLGSGKGVAGGQAGDRAGGGVAQQGSAGLRQFLCSNCVCFAQNLSAAAGNRLMEENFLALVFEPGGTHHDCYTPTAMAACLSLRTSSKTRRGEML